MIKKIKMITFDLDDTLWDNKPTITNAEIETRKWIEDRVGKINWGDLNDFLILREDLIKKDPSIAWDISKLRVEIFKEKIKEFVSKQECESIAKNAFDFFLKKRHEIRLFSGVEDALSKLSKNYYLGVLTNGNADIDLNFFGLPKEQFGFSNNVLGLFGAPKFDKASFELNMDKKIIINLR